MERKERAGTKKTNDLAGFPLLLIVLVLASPQPLDAYIDPGAGSYLVQILVVGLLGASFVVKRFWGNIVAVFRRSESPDDKSSSSSE